MLPPPNTGGHTTVIPCAGGKCIFQAVRTQHVLMHHNRTHWGCCQLQKGWQSCILGWKKVSTGQWILPPIVSSSFSAFLTHCNDVHPLGLRMLSLMGKFIKVSLVSLRIQVNCVCLHMHVLSSPLKPEQSSDEVRTKTQHPQQQYAKEHSQPSRHGSQRERRSVD